MLTSRPYQPPADLPRLHAFLTQLHAENPDPHCAMQVGDLLWRIFSHGQAQPEANVRLWLDSADKLEGFAWFYAPNAVEMILSKFMRNEGALESAMIAWAEQMCYAVATPAAPAQKLITDAALDDEPRIALLQGLGFQQASHHMINLVRTLPMAPPNVALPTGYHIHHVAYPAEYAQRVELHRKVWHPSRVTLQSYTEMRQVAGYNPELDLVVEAPDGTFAAYCVCWIDKQNGLGLFEPVGTHPDYRQQGLGKALLTEGLRRLHAGGAHTALVTTGGSNLAARRLYEGVGFSVLHYSHDFVREIQPEKPNLDADKRR